MLSQNSDMTTNSRLLKRLQRVKEQPYRSFKMRYLLYSLPVILLISGLLSIVLAGFASASLEQQYRQQIGNVTAEYIEELRMIVLSRNIADLQEFLKKLSVRLDSLSIELKNAQSETLAAYSRGDAVAGEYTIEYTHLLLLQSVAGQSEEWRLIARIRPGPLVNLIDNFLLYQLLIIAMMVMGYVISTFIAVEKSVNKPLQNLITIVQRGLSKNSERGFNEEIPSDAILENDEFGELGIHLGELLAQGQEFSRRFENFSSQIGVVCFRLNYHEETMKFSANPEPVLGQPESAIRNINDFWALVSSDQRGEAKQAWYDLKETMQTQDRGKHKIELRINGPRDEFSAPSTENWVKMFLIWEHEDGKPSIQGYVCDISAERKREVEFLTQAERYRKIHENLPVGIWRSQSDRFVYMNQAMADALGYASPAEAIDKIKSINHDVYVSSVDRTFFFDELKKRDQVKNLEMRFKKANGEIFWGSLFGRMYQERNVQYVEGGFVEITQRKQAEDKLRTDEEFLRQSLATADIVSWQIDSVSGKMLLKGPVANLLGHGCEDIDTIKGFCRLVHSGDLQRFIEAIERSRRIENVSNRERNQIEFRICRLGKEKKTELRWLQSFFSIVDAPSVSRSGILRGLFIDITPLKEGEEKLKRAIDEARLDSQDKLQFFANISHDIRTPLNAIIGFSELLSPVLLEGKGEQYVGSILSASRSLISIVDNILDLARLEAGRVDLNLEPVAFVDLVRDLKLLASPDADKKQLALSISVDAEVPPILLLDEGRIRQVLMNLLGNAIKFTSKGAVSLKAALAHSAQRGKVNLLITVEDSGVGIPEDDLHHIFDPFSLKRGKGDRVGRAGINLAICERLVSLMNGSINVKSDFERGTRFEVLLREVSIVEGDHKSRLVAFKPQRSFSFPGQKVLVADDTASNRELLCEALGNAGLKVVAAKDGNEAIKLAKDEKPDLIFMDIRMPEKDGICAARELKCLETTSSIPIVAVTASVSFVEEARLKGFFDGFLSKPISLAKLFAEAARFLKHDLAESGTEKSDNSFLPPEAFEQLIEPWQLCETVGKDIMPLLAGLDGAIVISQVKELADFLKNIAVKHSFNLLTLESESLESCAGAFDVAGVRACCMRIHGILTQLLKVYSRGGG